MNDKGQIGLDLVKTIAVSLLVVSVLVVAGFLMLTSLTDVAEDIDTGTAQPVDETLTTVSTANENLLYYTYKRNSVCTNHIFSNATDGTVITSPNYTTYSDGCQVAYTGSVDGVYNNTDWNVTYNVTYSEKSVFDISGNLTSGLTDFFSNTGTIFAILVVVVIVLAIIIIIAVVSRVGGSGGGGGSKREYGSDTVMGI